MTIDEINSKKKIAIWIYTKEQHRLLLSKNVDLYRGWLGYRLYGNCGTHSSMSADGITTKAFSEQYYQIIDFHDIEDFKEKLLYEIY